MQRYFGASALVLMFGMVLTRLFVLNREGIKAMKFGQLDRKDFLIPPFALFYFYLVFAAAFGWPSVSTKELFHSETIAWAGVALCAGGLLLLLASLISFGRSFRVGIDADHPDVLITSGIFSISRNPIYVGFVAILIGQFLIFSNVVLLIYVVAGAWLIHRQVLREEEFMRGHYGQEYLAYCNKVRRYL